MSLPARWGPAHTSRMTMDWLNLRDAKNLMEEFASSISEDLLRRVIAQFCSRVNRCIEARGGLFE